MANRDIQLRRYVLGVSLEDSALFKNTLSDISLNFTVYRELFDNTDAVDTMNRFHSYVFGNYQKCLVDALYLELAKLFDPKANRGDKNLSFSYLISLTDNDHHSELDKDLDELKVLFEDSKLKLYRNKLLAHNDLKALLGNRAAKPEVTSETLEAMLDQAWSLFGKIEHYLGVTDRAYKTSAYIRLPTGADIDEFIAKLKERT